MAQQDRRVHEFPFVSDGSALPDEYARLREREPVAQIALPSGQRAWLVTRHADVRTVFSDPRFSRAAAEAPGGVKLGLYSPSTDAILGMDPPDHTRIRRLVARAFTPGRIERLRPKVLATAEHLLGELSLTPAPRDLLAGFALPLTTAAIVDLLGVPDANLSPLHTWTPLLFGSEGAAAADAFLELRKYLREVIEAFRRNPIDAGVLGALVASRDSDDQLTEEELVQFSLLLITAGHHSTANAIVGGLLELLRRPELLTRLREHPGLIPGAVEELLRHNQLASIGAFPRVALVDVELGGVVIPAGDTVLVSVGSANHDERVFPSAKELDLSRDTRPHLAFGHGPHFCVGAQLARMEIQVAVRCATGLLPPSLRLAVPVDEVRYQRNIVGFSVTELLVHW
jgi:cytochrome P450